MKSYLSTFWNDPATFQRVVAGLVSLAGALLTTGGVIPGTSTVLVHVPPGLAALGPLVTTAAVTLSGGRGLPGSKASLPATTPVPATDPKG